MDLARKKLIAKRNVSPHNRLKIFEFLDYLETQEISLPRRIRYLQQMSKLAAFLQVDFRKATRSQIESVILKHGRLDLADETKVQFKIMTKRFYRWLKDPNDEEYPPEVKWIKTTARYGALPLPEDVLNEKDVEALLRKESSQAKGLTGIAVSSFQAQTSARYDRASGSNIGLSCPLRGFLSTRRE